MPRHQALQVLQQELQESRCEFFYHLGAGNANISSAAQGILRFWGLKARQHSHTYPGVIALSFQL